MTRNTRPANRTPLAAVTGFLAALAALTLPAGATDIQTIMSPGGIEARLVENHAAPLIAVSMTFKGGGTQDPADKSGVANFANCMFNEGAGALRTQEFMQKLHIELSASFDKAATDESHSFNFKTVSANRDAVFDLIGQMFQEPRYDEDALARCKDEIGVMIDAANQNSDVQQRLKLYSMMFGDHPLAKSVQGTRESLAAMTKEDVIEYRRRVLSRDNMKIAVVGDISQDALGPLLDKTFGKLPAKGDLIPEPPLQPSAPGLQTLEYDVPQASIIFGSLVELESDQERAATDIINHIVGGGDLDSRLMMELREKRGLVYSVSVGRGSTLLSDYIVGGAATDNDKVAEVIATIRAQMADFIKNGMSDEELARAKSVLKGSRLIGTRLSPVIANRLSADWFWGKGPEHFNSYGSRIDGVTKDDIRRVAEKLYKPEALAIVVVGKGVKL